MSIYTRVLNPAHGDPTISARMRVPGYQAGAVLHGGTCPLRGQQTYGPRGPWCTAACSNPSPPIYVRESYRGLVLEVSPTATTATVWDLRAQAPHEVQLPDDPVLPAYAEVDAAPDLQQAYQDWKDHQILVAMIQQEEQAERQRQHAARQAEIMAARIATAAKAEELRQRRIASRVRVGSKVRVVEDPPGFAARMRSLKPRHRTPSSVGIEGICRSADDFVPHIVIQETCGTLHRVLRSQVRVVFSDGTLGDEDPGPTGPQTS